MRRKFVLRAAVLTSASMATAASTPSSAQIAIGETGLSVTGRTSRPRVVPLP